MYIVNSTGDHCTLAKDIAKDISYEITPGVSEQNICKLRIYVNKEEFAAFEDVVRGEIIFNELKNEIYKNRNSMYDLEKEKWIREE